MGFLEWVRGGREVVLMMKVLGGCNVGKRARQDKKYWNWPGRQVDEMRLTW